MRWRTHPGRRRTTSRWAAPIVALALAAGLSGCSGGGGDDNNHDSGSPGGSTGTDGPAPVKTVTTVEKVSGHLDAAKQALVSQGVGEVVDHFLDGAYLGDFPRTDYSAAFTDFTSDAAADAMKQLDVMSNEPLSSQITAATATNRRVRLDVFAPKGKPHGVNAHFVLDFETKGGQAGRTRVHGELYLVKWTNGWKVFGYDVDQAGTL